MANHVLEDAGSAAQLEVALPHPATSKPARFERFLENERFLAFILLAPAVILLSVFIAYPFVMGVWLSLSSTSVGIPGQFDDPRLKQAIERIRTTGIAKAKSGGLHVVEPAPDQLREHIARGFRFLAYSLDSRMLDTASSRTL